MSKSNYKEANMESDRFLRFILLVEGIHKSVQKIKYNNATNLGVKGVHVLWVYELLRSPDGMTASELAAVSNIDRSLISREIASLRKLGYVEEDSHSDKRSYNAKLRLTEKGKEIAREISDVAIGIQQSANAGISEEELATFYSVVEKLYENLSEIADVNKN